MIKTTVGLSFGDPVAVLKTNCFLVSFPHQQPSTPVANGYPFSQLLETTEDRLDSTFIYHRSSSTCHFGYVIILVFIEGNEKLNHLRRPSG